VPKVVVLERNLRAEHVKDKESSAFNLDKYVILRCESSKDHRFSCKVIVVQETNSSLCQERHLDQIEAAFAFGDVADSLSVK